MVTMLKRAQHIFITLACLVSGCAPAPTDSTDTTCEVTLFILGVAQDAGKPQIGNNNDPAWNDPALQRTATSLALIDSRPANTNWWLFEATPDLKRQLYNLGERVQTSTSAHPDGVFLTHAHIGHYTGLMMFGHEAMGAENMTVYAMPQMADFLAENGPWSQLVRYHNIILAIMAAGQPEQLAADIVVTPFLVPHRQEFSEVAGFRIDGPNQSALFIPDIDSWEDWDAEGTRIEEVISDVDIAYLDATFFADGEIPGRDMSGFPHPFVSHSMERFSSLPESERAKVRFIHMNHTNPLLAPNAPERITVKKNGFNIAEEGETICL